MLTVQRCKLNRLASRVRTILRVFRFGTGCAFLHRILNHLRVDRVIERLRRICGLILESHIFLGFLTDFSGLLLFSLAELLLCADLRNRLSGKLAL